MRHLRLLPCLLLSVCACRTAGAPVSPELPPELPTVPRDVAELWARMCPAHVYEVGEADGDGSRALAGSSCTVARTLRNQALS